MAYLLDANVFIEAKNLYYGFDVCPAFWDWLIAKHEVGAVFSVEKVHDELLPIDDALVDWASERGPSFFRSPTDADSPSLATVRRWAETQEYRPTAIETFLQGGDYYLVGQALTGGHTVVTLEKPAATQRIIKIPDACIGVGVKCINTFRMLRMERARFVLGAAP